jgi:hypothetical protein
MNKITQLFEPIPIIIIFDLVMIGSIINQSHTKKKKENNIHHVKTIKFQ